MSLVLHNSCDVCCMKLDDWIVMFANSLLTFIKLNTFLSSLTTLEITDHSMATLQLNNTDVSIQFALSRNTYLKKTWLLSSESLAHCKPASFVPRTAWKFNFKLRNWKPMWCICPYICLNSENTVCDEAWQWFLDLFSIIWIPLSNKGACGDTSLL